MPTNIAVLGIRMISFIIIFSSISGDYLSKTENMRQTPDNGYTELVMKMAPLPKIIFNPIHHGEGDSTNPFGILKYLLILLNIHPDIG